MPELPSGTVTFLFTDIERSTQELTALGDASYAELQDIHRKLLRETFETHNGVEVGTEGDAFFVAFARAGDAVSSAIDGQRALEGQPVRVRMGLHTGEALVSGDDYVGLDVHKAKRISDAGHGGQILLSQTTADLVGRNASLVDLGPHRLKDLGEPQRLFQVASEQTFPALRTLDATPHNLPVQLTSFVGRGAELAQLAEMLATHRLVTLTGVGGCGKTRLAIHAAAGEIDSSPDGVYFCDLSRLSEEDALIPTLARSLGLDLAGPTPGQGALAAGDLVRNYLSTRRALLVLDNCEHLVAAAADLADDLLRSCADLRILATSREALEVDGEHTWSVPSLEASGDAAQLFAERAAAVRSGFSLSADNTEAVDAICNRLDGIPLAIELAAAQVGHLGPTQIAERLDDMFMMLTGGRRRVQRQQTLQATMDWSWDLLEERDQMLLRRLAVFQGGCTLEAAEAVCGNGSDVMAGLRSLVSKSLVIATDDERGSVRYKLLETVRLYSEQKLGQSGESEERRTRHRDHYLAWVEAIPLERTIYGTPFGNELDPEEDNIRAALRWSEAQNDIERVARMLVATRRMWIFNYSEAPDRFAAALAADLEPELRGPLISCYLAVSAVIPGVRQRMSAEAVELFTDQQSPWLAPLLSGRATVVSIQALVSRDETLVAEALELAERAVEAGRALGPFWEGQALASRANIELVFLRHADAARSFQEVVAKIPPTGPHAVPGIVVESLLALKQIMGEAWTDELDSVLNKVLAQFESEPWGFTQSGRAPFRLLLSLSDVTDLNRTLNNVREVLRSGRGLAPDVWYSVVLTYAGVLEAEKGRWDRAARLLSAAISHGIIGSAAAYALHRHWTPKVREAVGPERARQLRDEGRSMTLDQALDYLLSDEE